MIPHSMNDAMNSLNGLSLNFFSSAIINTPPHPYIGSQGPYCVPRFTNTPCPIKW